MEEVLLFLISLFIFLVFYLLYQKAKQLRKREQRPFPREKTEKKKTKKTTKKLKKIRKFFLLKKRQSWEREKIFPLFEIPQRKKTFSYLNKLEELIIRHNLRKKIWSKIFRKTPKKEALDFFKRLEKISAFPQKEERKIKKPRPLTEKKAPDIFQKLRSLIEKNKNNRKFLKP